MASGCPTSRVSCHNRPWWEFSGWEQQAGWHHTKLAEAMYAGWVGLREVSSSYPVQAAAHVGSHPCFVSQWIGATVSP